MKKIDFFVAIICGLAVAWIADDFLREFAVENFYKWIFFIILPLLSVFCLQIAYLIGKKWLVILQIAKFILSGAFADVVDIKAFQFLFLFVLPNSIAIKIISFLIATCAKYWLNKYWAFSPAANDCVIGSLGGLQDDLKESIKKENIKEVAQFFIITLGALLVNVAAFYYFTKILGPQFQVPNKIWTEFSIILSALVAASINFLGYKFLVFKK
jgi:putative flippase GtrA